MQIFKVRTFIHFERLLGFVLIPLISFSIPLVTAVFRNKTQPETGAGYLLFFALTYMIWMGCRGAFFSGRLPVSLQFSYIRFAFRYYSFVIFYSFFISYAWFWFWFRIVFIIQFNIPLFAAIAVFLALFISAIYEIFILYYESLSRYTENLQLKKANWQSEINAIKARIEPHFLFNSLSTLQNLIIEDKPAANTFNLLLSQVYQQILEMSSTDFTTVEKEIQMLYNYFRLMDTRFPESARLSLQVADFNVNRLLLPPLSLQLLLENAFKHNYFSKQQPMDIAVIIAKGSVTVTNSKSAKPFPLQPGVPGGNGLKILSERFRLLMQKEINIIDHAAIYSVQLPCKKMTT
ncbi:MAG: histidine kinase [Chitinophagaceae bacterium]